MIPQIKHVQCPACRHVFKPFYVEKASRGVKRPSRGVIWSVSQELRFGSALDYGCGLIRNAPFLEQHFKRVDCADTAVQCERLRVMFPSRTFIDVDALQGEWGAVYLISVLHILPDAQQRANIIDKCLRLCGRDGSLIVEVPTWESYYYHGTRGEQYGDGFIFGSGQYPTFYKPFTATELAQLINDSGGIICAKCITKPTACYIAQQCK